MIDFDNYYIHLFGLRGFLSLNKGLIHEVNDNGENKYIIANIAYDLIYQ